MIKCLQYISANKFKYLLALGLATNIAASANATNVMHAAEPSTANALTNQNPYAGSLLRNAEMDKLASGLKKYCDVSRIVNSIVVKLPDSSLFRQGPLISITPHGKLLLTEIGDELRSYPNSLIYILDYMPVGTDTVEAELQTMAKVDVVERELLSHQIPSSRIDTEIEHRPMNGAGSDSGSKHASAFSLELHIVPNKFKL